MMQNRSFEGHKNWILTMAPGKVLAELSGHPLLESLYLTDVGHFPIARHHFIERKQGCNQHILIYCTEGKGFAEVAGKRLIIGKDTALLIPAGIGHAYGALEDDPWHIYWIHYKGSRAHLYNPGPVDGAYTTPVAGNKRPMLFRLFQSIIYVLEQGATLPNLIYTSQTLGYLLGVIYFLNGDLYASDQPPAAVTDRHSQQVNDTVAYMQAHIHENVTLDELAEQSNLSRSQLSLLFREKTGYSPISLFIHLKMQRACRYLDLSNLTIQQVATTLGYKDPYYFSRLFTRTIGMSPSAYRLIKKG